MSLKSRLIGASVVWIIAGVVAAGFVLSAIFKEHVEAQFYDELIEIEKPDPSAGPRATMRRKLKIGLLYGA